MYNNIVYCQIEIGDSRVHYCTLFTRELITTAMRALTCCEKEVEVDLEMINIDSQTRRHMRVEFVGSLLCSESFFSGYSVLQGWRSGESTLLPPMRPGFDSQARRHMWVEFVGSLLCTERFSPGTPVSPLLKNLYLTSFAFIVNSSLHCPQLGLQP